MGFAIVVTVVSLLCCNWIALVLGVLGIIFAAMAVSALRDGAVATSSQRACSPGRAWCC
nr:hypothetical protein [Maliibacterium massiliense]